MEELYGGPIFHEDPWVNYAIVTGIAFVAAAGAVVTNIVLYYFLQQFRKLLLSFIPVDDLQFVVDIFLTLINLSLTAAVAFFIDRRVKRRLALPFTPERFYKVDVN